MNNEQLIQEFIKQFTGPKRVEVERFLKSLTSNGVEFSDAIRQANSEFKSTGYTVKDLSNSIQGILNDLGGTTRVVNESTKSFRKLESIVRKIQDDQAGIYELSLKELRTNRTKAKSELDSLARTTEGLIRRAAAGEELTNKELELLLISENQFENQKAIIEILDERIEREKQLESAIGLTGAVLDNLNKIGVRALGGIGINLGTVQEAFEDARTAARDTAKQIENLGNANQINPFQKRLLTLRSTFRNLGQGIGEIFNDPLTLGLGLFTKITQQVLELNSAQNEVRRQTGQTVFGYNGILSSVENINNRAATTVDLLNTVRNITDQIGLSSTAVFSQEQLIAIAEAKELVGLTADQATKLGIVSKLTGQTIDSFEEGILRGADASNKFFKSAIAPKVALEEALNTSADIVVSLGMTPSKLGAAAVAAKALGLELSKVDSIAEGLLNFESSIQNELEAQLLTGRNINLNRARELALTNDLEGLSQEIGKNIVTAAEFSKMNRLEQNGLAKALGLSRQELGEIILQTSLNNSLTERQRASVLGITEAQLENLDATKSIEKSVQSITQSFAPLLENIVDLLEKTKLIQAVISVGFAAAVSKFISGLILSVSQLKLANLQTLAIEAQLASAAASSVLLGTSTAASNIGGLVLANKFGTITGQAGTSAAAGTGAATAVRGFSRFIPYIGPIIGALTLLPYLKNLLFADDMISKPGYGDRILLDKGSITSLNNDDYITASTNPPGSGNKRVEQLLERLVANSEKTGNVYLDGREVGTAVVMGSYKS